MYAITGITGRVGGTVARRLLEAGKGVRAIVRDATKAAVWAERGCDLALADMRDGWALAKALESVEGLFLLLPPIFDPAPGFPEIRTVIAAIKSAIATSAPPKIVCLSTIGAQATKANLLNQLGLVEQELRTLPIPITFLRAAWFMENAAWDVAPVRDTRVIASFLQPLDKPVPMVATADIGQLAAELLQETWEGCRVVELEGPRRVTPNEIATTFASILGYSVRADLVPRDTWDQLFISQGAKNPTPRAQMLDGFNEGWIEFESATRKGKTDLEVVLRELLSGG